MFFISAVHYYLQHLWKKNDFKFYNNKHYISGEKNKQTIGSDSESDTASKGASKRKKGSDSGSDTSSKPTKKKSKKLVDSDDENQEKTDTGKYFCILEFNSSISIDWMFTFDEFLVKF